jgi:hypothetical protein
LTIKLSSYQACTTVTSKKWLDACEESISDHDVAANNLKRAKTHDRAHANIEANASKTTRPRHQTVLQKNQRDVSFGAILNM